VSLDLIIFNVIHSLAGQSKILDWLGIFAAQYLGYFLIVAAVLLIWKKEKSAIKRWYYFAFLALSLILSLGVITETIRFVYNRPRPFVFLNFTPLIHHSGGAAMPSGHAAFYFALAFAMILVNKLSWPTKIVSYRMLIFFLGAALLMGIARVFVGVHWPTDIIAGAIVGFLGAFVAYYLLRSTFKSA